MAKESSASDVSFDSNNEEKRTIDIGLFNYAHSYWASASVLQSARVMATHPDAPVYYLYFHAVELFLKSYLRLKGCSTADIKSLGHDINKLAKKAGECGLELEDGDRGTIGMIKPNYLTTRYIKVGYHCRPHLDALWNLCSFMFDKIGEALIESNRTKRLPKRPDYPNDVEIVPLFESSTSKPLR